MNSPFGVKRVYNGVFSGNYHKGLDQKSPQGHPIVAAEGGKIVIARTYRLHGGTVGIDHGQGLSSIYIHMSRIDVKPGDVVKKGQTIGKIGATGFAAGPHLHWGVYAQGVAVDPKPLTPGISPC
jgi:murein DD-endopeptidase MepM/ murein hydrolase activator NlpD